MEPIYRHLSAETIARLRAQAHAAPRRTPEQNAIVAGIVRNYQARMARQAAELAAQREEGTVR